MTFLSSWTLTVETLLHESTTNHAHRFRHGFEFQSRTKRHPQSYAGELILIFVPGGSVSYWINTSRLSLTEFREESDEPEIDISLELRA